MLKKESYLRPCDKCGVLKVRIFHLYKGFSRKTAYLGDFVKVSVRVLKKDALLLKKTKVKSLIIRTRKGKKKRDGSLFSFINNNSILLKKRTTSFGKRIYGPMLRNLKRRKLLMSAPCIL